MNEESQDARNKAAPLNILIVDDSAVMRTMIKRVTGLCGVRVGAIYEATNGREALAVLETHDVDVLFTDINMPIMTGIELLREINRSDRFAHLLRVIISTDGSTARRIEAQRLNVRLYVEKPFRPEVMRDVLSQITTSADAA